MVGVSLSLYLYLVLFWKQRGERSRREGTQFLLYIYMDSEENGNDEDLIKLTEESTERVPLMLMRVEAAVARETCLARINFKVRFLWRSFWILMFRAAIESSEGARGLLERGYRNMDSRFFSLSLFLVLF